MLITVEKQVVSRVLAQRMNALGYNRDGIWYWYKRRASKMSWAIIGNGDTKHKGRSYCFNPDNYDMIFSAPTLAELGVEFPILKKDKEIYTGKDVNGYFSGIMDCFGEFEHMEYAKKESDARAKLWIYMKINKII